MKLFVAMLGTETNTFSPVPTGLNQWRETLLARSSEPRDEDPPMLRGAKAVLGGAASFLCPRHRDAVLAYLEALAEESG